MNTKWAIAVLAVVVISIGSFWFFQNHTLSQGVDISNAGPPPQGLSDVPWNSPLTATPSTGKYPLHVVFTYRGEAGLTANESIDFGDGTVGKMVGDPTYSCPPNAGCLASAFYVNHTYATSGNFHVILRDQQYHGMNKADVELGRLTITVPPSN